MISPMTPVELMSFAAADTATNPITSVADLRRRWCALMGPLGFGERLLRFVFVGPDRCFVKILSEVPIGTTPDARLIDNLMVQLGEFVEEQEAGTTVAFLLTRPGGGPVSNADRKWAQLVRDSARRVDIPIEPFFRANDESLELVGSTT